MHLAATNDDFPNSPERDFLAAVQAAQASLESARAAYCLGFQNRANLGLGVAHLAVASSRVREGFHALAAIAERG